MSARETVAKAIEDRPVGDWSIGPQTALRLADAAIAAHLKALADERVVAVELPEQMVDRSNVAESLRGEPMWETGGSWTCLTSPDCIEFEAAHQTEYGTLSVREARELAAALLAAADAAEASR